MAQGVNGRFVKMWVFLFEKKFQVFRRFVMMVNIGVVGRVICLGREGERGR